jgi:hypothetical protein
MFLYIKKSERIEAFSIRKETRGFIHEECFDTHIRKSVFEIWADSDNGSTGALHVSGRGSIPRRSTIIISRWCNGSTWVSKTLGRSSSLWRDAKIKFAT